MGEKDSIVCLKHRAVTWKGFEENNSCSRNVIERASFGRKDGTISVFNWEQQWFLATWDGPGLG